MGELVRLSPVVQGVEFTVIEQDVKIRGLILRDALEEFFGAGEAPSTWLQAYHVHCDAIDCAAADRYRADPRQVVVVLRAERPHDFSLHAQRMTG